MGGITKEELKMTHYAKDSIANALVLFDIGTSVFEKNNSGFDIKFTRKTRIKIFNKSGYKHANIQIPFYSEGQIKEEVKNIQAVAYHLKGGSIERTVLNPKDIFTENINEKWNRKIFTIPGVTEGVILEYSYEHITPFNFNLSDWDFQWTIPVAHSSYEVRMIPFYEYVFTMQGHIKPDSHVSYLDESKSRKFGQITYQEMVYRTTMLDVPAFKDESYITSINDYKSKMSFQLSKVIQPDGSSRNIMTTWDRLKKDYLKAKAYGQYLKASRRQGSKLLSGSLDLNPEDPVETAIDIINYVKSNFLWSGIYSKYATKTASEFIKEKKGNSAEINLFLTGLLQSADIDANPVLISTRDHGKIHTNYPFSHYFNSSIIIVNANGKQFLTDGTNPAIPHYLVPQNTLNELGLVMAPGDLKWISINILPSKIHTALNIAWEEDTGLLNIHGRTSMTGYDALQSRIAYKDEKDKISKALSNKGYADVSITKTNNFAKVDEPYKIHFKSTTDLESFGNKAYISPFFHETSSLMAIREEKRVYPIDIGYTKERHFASTINAPNGYHMDSPPEDYFVNDDLVNIKYSVKSFQKSIQVTGSYTLKKQIYQPEQYEKLKEHLSKIHALFNQPIAFIKD